MAIFNQLDSKPVEKQPKKRVNKYEKVDPAAGLKAAIQNFKKEKQNDS